MRKVKLLDIYNHSIAQKYLDRSGLAHAIAVANFAFKIAKEYKVNPDLAAKAGLLHDIGHYTWYKNGKWDYEGYEHYDIHPIKGAERAHKLLIRLGEEPESAKLISLAILFHSDSFFPEKPISYSPLQKVVMLADNEDKEAEDKHHYRKIDREKVFQSLRQLDEKIEKELELIQYKEAL